MPLFLYDQPQNKLQKVLLVLLASPKNRMQIGILRGSMNGKFEHSNKEKSSNKLRTKLIIMIKMMLLS